MREMNRKRGVSPGRVEPCKKKTFFNEEENK
jgi:hypothetical protein